jgi:exonuclease SbcD
MGFRIVHTSDWHLGQRLDRLDRSAEHRAFLEWLLGVLDEERPALLVVCGDVFDTANPPVEAVGMLYGFLARAHAKCPSIVVIGGNHDSGLRLDVVTPLLPGTGIRMIGAYPGNPDGCVVPVTVDGKRLARVAAVPYLRPYDLATARSGETEAERTGRIVESVAARFAEVQDAVEAVRKEGEALIVLGHLFVVGGAQTPESERPVQVEAGRIAGVPPQALGNRATCILLGHLHRPQQVKAEVPVLYAGAPIPLTFDEASYASGIAVVDVDDAGRVTGIRRRTTPRMLDLVEIEGTLDECRSRLCELATRESKGEAADREVAGCRRGLVKVTVRLDGPVPGLREELAALLDGSGWTLAMVRREASAEWVEETAAAGELLDQLLPDEVFRRKYARQYPGQSPSPVLVDTFHELLEEEQASEGEP